MLTMKAQLKGLLFVADSEKVEIFVRKFLSLSLEDQAYILSVMEDMLRMQNSKRPPKTKNGNIS